MSYLKFGIIDYSKIYISLCSGNNMNIMYHRYLEKLDKEIAEAVDNRDAFVYFHKCNEAGIKPDLLDLYEQGQADSDFNLGNLERIVKKNIKKRKRIVSDSIYKSFYNEVFKLNLTLDIGANTDKKIELLIKYFPGRFGDKGRSPVYKMEPLSVGALFRKMFNYSGKRINE